MTTNPPFVLMPQLTVQLTAEDSGKPLPGIYVLYRVAPPPEPPPEEGFLAYLRNLVTSVEHTEPPPPPYHLAISDENGFLQHATEQHNLAPLAECAVPETLKLSADVPYEMYFVRHPDAQLAEAALDELNGARPPFRTTSWPAPAVFTMSVEHCVPLSEDQLTLKVPSEASAFQPAGPPRYGGWILYKDMPHADVTAVQDAVKQLQLDLGALRYIVGAEPPYEYESLRLDKKGKPINKDTVNEGLFDARTMSAVLHLQRQIVLGADGRTNNAFRVADKAAAHGRARGKEAVEGSWAYLQGQDVNVAPPTPEAHEAALKADGVVDAITGRAIEAWLNDGLRRPGAILVGVAAGLSSGWNVWVRSEAALALEAWRKITVALGSEKGVPVNHTYRTPLVDVGHAGYGRSAVSIHKTGLAIDLRMSKFLPQTAADSKNPWPVLVDRDELVEQRDKQKNVTGHRVYFRLYTPSTLPADQAAAAATVRANLEPLAAAGGPTGEAAAQLLALDDDTLFQRYFATTARSWQYDPYDDEGGTEGPVVTAAAHWGNNTAYTCFVNLTEVGVLCGFKRIGSFTNKLDPTGSDWGLARSYIKASDIKKVGALADALISAQAKVHDPIDVTFKGARVPLRDVQAQFLKQYADLLPQFPRPTCNVSGPRLRIAISWATQTRTQVETAAGHLESLGSGQLRGEEAGNAVKTGPEWAAWLREKIAELDPAAPAKCTEGGTTASAKPPQRITLLPVVGTSGGAPVVLGSGDSVGYPAPGNPIGMEWWHFQYQSVVSRVRRFGSLLCDLGWTEEGLLESASATTYWRRGAGYPQSELDKKVG